MSCVLILNGGWSDIKIAFSRTGRTHEWRLRGQIDRMEPSGTLLTSQDPVTTLTVQPLLAAASLLPHSRTLTP